MRKTGMKGFTLIEVLATTVIFTIIIGGVYGIFNIGNKFYSTDIGFMEMQQEARNGMDRMVREIRASSTAAVTVISADNDRITFTVPGASGVQYYLSGSQLVREYPSGTVKTIAKNISHLKFTLNAPLLKIDLIASQTVLLKAFAVNLIENVRLRNE